MVRLEGDRWVVERIGSDGKRRTLPDVMIPPDATEPDFAGYLEAAYHELAAPGGNIIRIQR